MSVRAMVERLLMLPRWLVGLMGLAFLLLLVAFVLLALPDGPVTRLFRQDYVWTVMQRHNVWRVGMDPSFPPFEDLDDAGKPVGYDIDLAARLAERWGLELEIVALGFDSLPDALQAGRVDSIVSAWPYDPRATRDFAFSQPYFDAGLRLVVRDGSPIQGVEELDGKRIAVEWGSEGDMIGRRLQREGVGVELVPFSTPGEAIAGLVEDDSIDVLLVDNVTLRQAQGSGVPIIAVGAPLEGNPYVIVSPHAAYELETQIAETLEALAAEGVLDQLADKWFGPSGQ